MDNDHGSNKSDATAAKKSRKNLVDARFDKKSNRLEAEVSQSTYQTNINGSG